MPYSSIAFDPQSYPSIALMSGDYPDADGEQLVVVDAQGRIHIPYMWVILTGNAGVAVTVEVHPQAPDGALGSFAEEFTFTKRNNGTERFRIPGPFDLLYTGYIEITTAAAAGTIKLVIPHISFEFRGDFEWADLPLYEGILPVDMVCSQDAAEHDEPVVDKGPQEMLSAFEISGTEPTDAVDADYDTVRARGSRQGVQHILLTDEKSRMSPMSELINAIRGINTNPDALRESFDEIINSTDISATTRRFVIPMDGFKLFSITWVVAGGVTLTLYQSNHPDADETADTGWTQVVTFGVQVDNSDTFHMGFDFKILHLMLKVVTSDTSNSLAIYTARGN